MFVYFLHKTVVNGIFHIFNMATHMVAKGQVTIIFIIGSNKSFI